MIQLMIKKMQICKVKCKMTQTHMNHLMNNYHHILITTQSNQNTNPGVITSYNRPTDISDDILRQTVRSLNIEQRHAYDTFLSWCRDTMKNMNSLKPVEIEPLYLF